MNADQARQVLLVRAVEDVDAADAPMSPSSPIWSAADADWADAEALRRIGEQSTGEHFVAERALLASERLAERDATMASLRRGSAGNGHVAVVVAALLVLALLAGLATDALGPSGQVNLLAPPLLALMAWNIAVYAVLLGAAVWRPLAARHSDRSPNRIDGMVSMLASKFSAHRLGDSAPPAAKRFVADWTLARQPIDRARLAGIFHLAALAVAAGALLALYARGLVFEFRAGWDSTFVDALFVHHWLGIVLAPAQAISGVSLPDAAQIETLRFSRGPGENAARWIHWYAITTGLVMLPRLALAAAAMLARTATGAAVSAADATSAISSACCSARHAPAAGQPSRWLSCHAATGWPAICCRASLPPIDHEFGPGLQLKLFANMAAGVDDMPAEDWPGAALDRLDVQWLLPLFALSATPERETHGAFIRSAQQRAAALPGHPPCRVMIDESGFRQRLAGADLPRRLADRRAAWQKLLDEIGAGPALFVDLGERSAPDTA